MLPSPVGCSCFPWKIYVSQEASWQLKVNWTTKRDTQAQQGVAGNAGGRQGRHVPPESPGAPGAEKGADTVVSSCGVSVRIRRRPLHSRQGPSGGNAGGGRAAHGDSEAARKRVGNSMPKYSSFRASASGQRPALPEPRAERAPPAGRLPAAVAGSVVDMEDVKYAQN